jgi:ribosomal protein L37E
VIDGRRITPGKKCRVTMTTPMRPVHVVCDRDPASIDFRAHNPAFNTRHVGCEQCGYTRSNDARDIPRTEANTLVEAIAGLRVSSRE